MKRPSWNHLKPNSSLIAPLAVIAILAAVILAPRPAEISPTDRGTAYTDAVNALFAAGHLEGSTNRAGASKVGLTASCRKDANCFETVRDFALKSYLREDMKQAGDDTWILRDNRITGLQAFTRLYYDNDVDQAVAPPRIVYASSGVGNSDNDRIQIVDLDRGQSCDFGPGESRGLDAAGLCNPAPASGCALSLTTRVAGGTQAYVTRLTPVGCGELSADGKLTSEATVASGTLLRIDTGAKGTRPARLLITGVSGVIAASDSQGTRYYDHGFVDLARYLERASGDLTPQLKSANEIRLSLVRRLNLQANRLLSEQIRPQVTASGRNILAGAVFMDGVTGEVVAVPSFPLVKEDLRDPLPQSDPRLDQNVNFMNLSIGSAAKVPFAAAIVSRWPELRGLKVADNEATVGPVLGYPGTFASHNHGAPVDFNRFIAESSNRYAITLMAAGLRTGPALECDKNCRRLQNEQGVWLGERRIQTISAPMMKSPSVASEWRGYLKDYFDIAPENCLENPEYGLVTLWGRKRLGQAYELNAPPLCLTQVKNVTPDYYMSILGGSRSLWSTLSMAQTYGRIVSNRKVEATLLARDSIRDGYRRLPFPDMKMPADLHQAIRAGMKATVILPSGTGRRLVNEGSLCNTTSADGGYTYVCYAKTGTGRIRAGEDVHSLALVVEKIGVEEPAALCSRSIFAINIQHRREDASPAITYAIATLKDPITRLWIDRPCNGSRNNQ